MRRPSIARLAATIVAALPAVIAAGVQDPVFKAGVAVVEVAATVTDDDGRFVRGLTKEDFIVYDDGRPQEIVAFSSERRPVSLGVLLDVSVSMSDEQLATARSAIDRFIGLVGDDDELFLMEFASRGRMLQSWTRDRQLFRAALARANRVPLTPVDQGHSDAAGRIINSGTAVFDAVATSLPFAAKGEHRKKAVLIISDGVDTSSTRSVREVQDAIRASEVLVYALGVDAGLTMFGLSYSGVDARSLRRLTDDTGGRTEVVNGVKNLAQATARLADEFNQQYVIGYAMPQIRDRRWHTIKVDVRTRGTTVRARAGYFAS
jgi:Ca-activated chloride channel homolog